MQIILEGQRKPRGMKGEISTWLGCVVFLMWDLFHLEFFSAVTEGVMVHV